MIAISNPNIGQDGLVLPIYAFIVDDSETFGSHSQFLSPV
jgi:hypothetical protein